MTYNIASASYGLDEIQAHAQAECEQYAKQRHEAQASDIWNVPPPLDELINEMCCVVYSPSGREDHYRITIFARGGTRLVSDDVFPDAYRLDPLSVLQRIDGRIGGLMVRRITLD